MSSPTSSTSSSKAPESRSILQDVISSIFEPGTNSGLIQAMSYSFYALFVTLFGMIILTGGNGHVIALFGLSVGLFASLKWFLVQIKEVEEKLKLEKEKEEREKKLNPEAKVGDDDDAKVETSGKGKLE